MPSALIPLQVRHDQDGPPGRQLWDHGLIPIGQQPDLHITQGFAAWQRIRRHERVSRVPGKVGTRRQCWNASSLTSALTSAFLRPCSAP